MKFWLVAIMIILAMFLFVQCIPPDNTYEIFVIDRYQSVTSATDIETPKRAYRPVRGVIGLRLHTDLLKRGSMW